MKKMLVLTSRPPFPLLGGDKIRVYNSIKTLSKEYNIDLLYIDTDNISVKTKVELQKYCRKIMPVVVAKHSHIINTFIGLVINNKPLQVNYYYFRKIKKWILSNYQNYDSIYCNHIRTTEYVKELPIRKSVDLVDSIALNYTKAYKNSWGLWKLIYAIEKTRVKKYELEIVRRFDNSVIISEIDRKFIDPNNIYNIRVIGNYVNAINFNKKIEPNIDNLCFLGKMDYEPNVNAVLHFVKYIFPLLKAKNLNLKFRIIGARPIKKIMKLQKIAGVSVTGFVENPYNLIQSCALFIAPMISGAGVQNKILEVMKMGKCVVTTTIGAEGLNDLKGNELVICSNDNQMISQILFLLSNPNKIKEIGNNAIQYINKQYSATKIEHELLICLKD